MNPTFPSVPRAFVTVLFVLLFPCLHAANSSGVAVNWQAFLARHDLVWDKLPDKFDHGAFLGNGLMGATVYQEGERGLRFEMGRSDVTEHRRDNNRLPIGGLVLNTVGKLQGGTMRVDLWNAELSGSLATDQGTLRFRSYIHTDVMALICEVESTGGEQGVTFTWVPGEGQDKMNQEQFKDPPNPSVITESVAGLPVCIQPRFAGGEFATAWKETATPAGRRLVLSIADSFPGNGARQEAAATVLKTVALDAMALQTSHRAWWHAMYPKSFVSVPDARLESFYWIQFYKLASASRPDQVPVDLLGPWYRNTGWPRIWWNLNIQTLYLPVYTANQLDLGASFVRFLDTKRANFVRNAYDLYGIADGATVPHTTCYEGLRGDGSRAPSYFINPGDFTWALHNYYLHYRYSMDHTMVTNQDRHAFYPLLRGSINVYLSLLKKGDDGRLHLPVLHSPEYGNSADNNYNLGLLRWGLKTLMELNERYQLNEPLMGKWRETLDTLTPYPTNENGLMVGANTPFSKPHRHWSHMLMVHPLHLLDLDDPANKELLTTSILHWLKTGDTQKGDGIYGWSRAGAASLYATMGDGENAIESIHKHMDDKRFVQPNTMYIEGSPVIECSIVLARSLQDMLLQSHGDLIRVFPAIPTAWQDAVFHDLRTEGAFLVSARRQSGRTAWVRVRSLAGEPCHIRPGFSGPFTTTVGGKVTIPKHIGNGSWELSLAKDEEALLIADPNVSLSIEPLPMAESEANQWGRRERKPGL
ncbi:MAG: Tat pathway signal sequence domain protein [Verrucomicrobia bacterium]|nr:Tat pathway signal sequence domain protein [Verrucomicrobiota bacterium]